jgi:hypothetical protein
MREISYKELEPGVEYYIDSYRLSSIIDNVSGKKIGTFVKIIYGNPIMTQFNNLHDVPGANLKSGLGSSKTNQFSVLGTKFYLPENENLYTKSVIRQKIGDPNFDYGGKIKKTKCRKSLNKKNKKTNKKINKKTNKRKKIRM